MLDAEITPDSKVEETQATVVHQHPDTINDAVRVIRQFERLPVDQRTETWAIALAKTQCGLSFIIHDTIVFFVFLDRSYCLLSDRGFSSKTGYVHPEFASNPSVRRIFR